jgi:Cu/Ag efflux pump CusA
MILAMVFESVTTPLVILFSIPLAAIGSLLALYLTGNSLLNANTLMGFSSCWGSGQQRHYPDRLYQPVAQTGFRRERR